MDELRNAIIDKNVICFTRNNAGNRKKDYFSKTNFCNYASIQLFSCTKDRSYKTNVAYNHL